jgi:hypothetical protein
MYVEINDSTSNIQILRINKQEALIMLQDLSKFKDILKSVNLDLFDKKEITLIFEDKFIKISYKFYNLTSKTYKELDTQIIKLFFN